MKVGTALSKRNPKPNLLTALRGSSCHLLVTAYDEIRIHTMIPWKKLTRRGLYFFVLVVLRVLLHRAVVRVD